ncbi:MAG: carbohydrate ABC transporter permease [Spirochaetae bacterium HGW-Spirochaetae-4]|nr:MAG: carbohydrate ABC transporter permease [Spirochaetae bacterium HGW-Spirochaetae-4]HCS37534.1 carbohydrate ABC transporter permease [Sphaerochaeta sp.]
MMNLDTTKRVTGKTIAYIVLVSWTLITVLPLIWMGYSSFKSNEELVRDIYAFPKALFDNKQDDYVVIRPQLNVIPDYDVVQDPRERVIIESTTISPERRLMVHFLVKEDLPESLRLIQPGDIVSVSQLPSAMQREIHWKTVFFNYRSAIARGNLGQKFVNSLIYSITSTFLVNLFALMAAFAMSKMQFRKLSLVVGGLIGLGYLISINSLIIPLFLMLTKLGLTDTHVGIILVYTAFGLPLAVMLDTQFVSGIPSSLIESARMDGAGTFRVLTAIIVPMATPVIVTVSIITALGIWNEFLLVLVLASSEATKSLPVGVFSFSSLTSTQLGWQLAALVVATLPVMVVYFLFQKRLAEGVVGGAIKG